MSKNKIVSIFLITLAIATIVIYFDELTRDSGYLPSFVQMDLVSILFVTALIISLVVIINKLRD